LLGAGEEKSDEKEKMITKKSIYFLDP